MTLWQLDALSKGFEDMDKKRKVAEERAAKKAKMRAGH